MNASQLRVLIEDEIPTDEAASQAVCRAFRVLRRFLEANVVRQSGVTGWIFRRVFPKTAEGLRAVVALLADYERDHCGR